MKPWFKIRETTSPDSTWRRAGIELSTGGGMFEADPKKPNVLCIALWKKTWWIDVPRILKPRAKVVHSSNPATVPWIDYITREYGFMFHETDVHVHYGVQTGSWSASDKKNSDHVLVFTYPWSNQRQISNLQLSLDLSQSMPVEDWKQLDNPDYSMKYKERVQHIPVQGYADIREFADNDGQVINARLSVAECKYSRGQGFWKFLSWFPNGMKTYRHLELIFDSEIGPEKGSYKGGTVGMSIPMDPKLDTVDTAWMTFLINHRNRKR